MMLDHRDLAEKRGRKRENERIYPLCYVRLTHSRIREHDESAPRNSEPGLRWVMHWGLFDHCPIFFGAK